MKIDEWTAIFAGVVIGIGACWIHDKFLVLEYKIGELENPKIHMTNAEGEDGDPEVDDVKGSIGFVRQHG